MKDQERRRLYLRFFECLERNDFEKIVVAAVPLHAVVPDVRENAPASNIAVHHFYLHPVDPR